MHLKQQFSPPNEGCLDSGGFRIGLSSFYLFSTKVSSFCTTAAYCLGHGHHFTLAVSRLARRLVFLAKQGEIRLALPGFVHT